MHDLLRCLGHAQDEEGDQGDSDLNAHCAELFARLAPALSEKTCVSEQMVIEIGTTRVSVLFQQGRTYDVEIVTDALRSSRNSEPQTAGRHLPTPVRLVSNLCSQASTKFSASAIGKRDFIQDLSIDRG